VPLRFLGMGAKEMDAFVESVRKDAGNWLKFVRANSFNTRDATLKFGGVVHQSVKSMMEMMMHGHTDEKIKQISEFILDTALNSCGSSFNVEFKMGDRA